MGQKALTILSIGTCVLEAEVMLLQGLAAKLTIDRDFAFSVFCEAAAPRLLKKPFLPLFNRWGKRRFFLTACPPYAQFKERSNEENSFWNDHAPSRKLWPPNSWPAALSSGACWILESGGARFVEVVLFHHKAAGAGRG